MITYPIHEAFFTFQGEGSAMGLPAYFVRTYGCPVRCSFCDSAGTWHPSWLPDHVARMTPLAIVQGALLAGATRMVVTGGEPTIFDLAPLVDEAQEARMEVHLETSGAFPIKGDFDWIMLSPKKAKLPLKESMEKADEFKFIIEKPEDIDFFAQLLLEAGYLQDDPRARSIWLHPEWSQRNNREVLAAIVAAVKLGGGFFRAGYQIHKLYNADAFDPNSKPLVPLGGVLEKGY